MKQHNDTKSDVGEDLSSEKGAAESYRGEQGAKYFAEHFQSRLSFGRKYQARYFLPFCGNRTTLLDFGCGDGTILSELPAAIKIGIELNPLCRERIREANRHLDVPIRICENIDEVEIDSVEVAISNHCLEHVETPLECLRKIRSRLVSGGKLVIVTPYDDWRSAVHREWTPHDADHHLHTWSPRNLGNLVQVAGFHVEQTRICKFTMSPKLYWIHRLLGDGTFRLACRLFSVYKCRREVFCAARKC